jgi:hypothetical protein
MRCQCCNRFLSDYESTLRRADNNEFVDICQKCLKDIPIATIGREDLNPFDNVEDGDIEFLMDPSNDEEE